MRKKIIAGNWKMYKTIEEAEAFINDLSKEIRNTDCAVYVAVPFTALRSAAEAAKGTSITIGAQNMNDASEGAFTGEIAAKMLLNAGAKFVILGHSERRHYFNESDAFINKKVHKALLEGLQPIVCFGETREQRKEGKAQETVEAQIIESLNDISAEALEKVILAYEPVWAIGTGETATPEIAEEMHLFCRQCIEKAWGKEVADNISILYGGSVRPDNVTALMGQHDIDGGLVGGASLTVESFSKIINYR